MEKQLIDNEVGSPLQCIQQVEKIGSSPRSCHEVNDW
jgi:hypothetical protein